MIQGVPGSPGKLRCCCGRCRQAEVKLCDVQDDNTCIALLPDAREWTYDSSALMEALIFSATGNTSVDM